MHPCILGRMVAAKNSTEFGCFTFGDFGEVGGHVFIDDSLEVQHEG
jgi:hypothetical protein